MAHIESTKKFQALIASIRDGSFGASGIFLSNMGLNDKDIQALIFALHAQPSISLKITTLALNANRISIAPDLLFAGLYNLENLFLNDNILKFAPNFTGLSKLKNVYLIKNQLISCLLTQSNNFAIEMDTPNMSVASAIDALSYLLCNTDIDPTTSTTANTATRFLSQNLFAQYFAEYAALLRLQRHTIFALNAERFYTAFVCLTRNNIPLAVQKIILHDMLLDMFLPAKIILKSHMQDVQQLFVDAIHKFAHHEIVAASLVQLRAYLLHEAQILLNKSTILYEADLKMIYLRIDNYNPKPNTPVIFSKTANTTFDLPAVNQLASKSNTPQNSEKRQNKCSIM